MFVTKLALERSEQNFVTKFNHVTHLAWESELHVHAQMVTPSLVPGCAIGQSLKGSVLLNIRKLFSKQPLERNEENFVPMNVNVNLNLTSFRSTTKRVPLYYM